MASTQISGSAAEAAAQVALTREQCETLKKHHWRKRIPEGIGVWVSVDEQMLRVIDGDAIVWQVSCATATRGTGSKKDSLKTPLGWHSIKRKIGAGAPWGQVFRSAKAVNEIWKPGDSTKEDLVLTRLLWLTGEEPGKNKGGDVDSFDRCIYIHGTNDEERIGTPSSHGCIRLRNDDVIVFFDMIPEGTMVLITEN
ncbi:MAG: L,D-transpeptidase [Candidatus Hydrogenedentes bacterium]|nr:L,D-transpeptidase [Candidatus Hydrogenedentota bacterium]